MAVLMVMVMVVVIVMVMMMVLLAKNSAKFLRIACLL